MLDTLEVYRNDGYKYNFHQFNVLNLQYRCSYTSVRQCALCICGVCKRLHVCHTVSEVIFISKSKSNVIPNSFSLHKDN